MSTISKTFKTTNDSNPLGRPEDRHFAYVSTIYNEPLFIPRDLDDYLPQFASELLIDFCGLPRRLNHTPQLSGDRAALWSIPYYAWKRSGTIFFDSTALLGVYPTKYELRNCMCFRDEPAAHWVWFIHFLRNNLPIRLNKFPSAIHLLLFQQSNFICHFQKDDHCRPMDAK